ncbi:MAG: carboxypeptidase regulatory-like domain-containing protein [Deltaproteobacteria bacterium]|nr:carboxypeptidase regulatory-like domain-containing protein [Deltaproteobacteria bacterium]
MNALRLIFRGKGPIVKYAITVAIFAIVVIGAALTLWFQRTTAGPSTRTSRKQGDAEELFLEIRVFDSKRKPIQNARLRLITEKESRFQKSDAKGTARLAAPALGKAKLLVEASGMERKTLSLFLKDNRHQIDVSLAKGENIRGEVVDDRGKYVANARIELQLQEKEAEEPWTAVSDGKGIFSLSTLKAGVYTLDIEAEGHERSVRRRLRIPSEEPVKIILRRTGSLSGRVVNTDGSAAKGSQVLIAGSGIWPARKVMAQEQGKFQIIGIPSGIYEVRASLENAASQPKQGLEIKPGGSNTVTLQLIPGVVLKGKVFDAISKKPLKNADITVGEDSLCFIPMASRTDDNGRFVVTGLLEKPHRVSIRSPGYVPVIGQIREAGGEEHLFPMRRAAIVAGKVVNSQGEPVEQAWIELMGTSETGEPITMRSEALRFQTSLFENQIRGPLPLSPSNQQLSADNLGVTAGVVPMIPPRDLDETAKTSKAKGDIESGFATDPQGRFQIKDIPPGTVQVIARHRDFAPATSKPLKVASGSTRGDLTLVLSEGGSVEGKVVDDKGASVGLVRIELSAANEPFPRTALSSEDGSFRFNNVIGEVVITASPLGRPAARADLRIEPKKLYQVQLKVSSGSATLEGRVLDQRGFPIEGSIVRVQSSSRRSPFEITVLSEPDGSFSLAGLPDPPYRVSATHQDYAESEPEEVTSSEHRLAITLETGVTINGTVIDDWRQQPIGGASVRLLEETQKELAKTKTTNKGKFQFRKISYGNYYISIEKQNYLSDYIELRLQSLGNRFNVHEIETIYLTPGGSVSGQVVDNQGAAVRDAEVTVGVPPMWQEAVRTDAKGEFRIEGIPSGSVILSARHKRAGEAELAQPIRVFPLQETPGVLIRLSDR